MTGPTSEHAKRSHNIITHESEIRAVWRALCVVDRFGDNDNEQIARNLARDFWHNACGIQEQGSPRAGRPRPALYDSGSLVILRNNLRVCLEGDDMNWFKQKDILVPYDFSEESKSAIEVALELAEKQSDIHVLHVMYELTVTDPGVIWHSIDDEKRRQHVIGEFTEKTADLEINDVHFEVGIGDPGAVIAEKAEEIDAGMIVIPSHGRTGLTRLMLGSVAERVVRLAKCPVLVLKKQRER